MTRKLDVLTSALFALGFVAYACTSGEVVTGPVGPSGSGGSTNPGTAGTNPAGVAGTTGAAGTAPARGGTTGTGNTAGTVTSRGGTTGTGNTAGTVTSRGGTTGTGNAAGTVGPGSAGTTGPGTAGTSGSGTAGTTGTCPPSFAVAANGFVQAPVAGGACWRGYAFAGKGMMDTGSMITPADFASCGMPCTLRMMGTVGSATMANNYTGVAFVGFNLAQDSAGGTPGSVTPTGNGVTVTFSATLAGLPLRAQLNTSSGTFYCYTITGTSPVMIPYASFNTTCWDPTMGQAYAKGAIASFQLVVPGGATNTPGVSVTLTSVTEN